MKVFMCALLLIFLTICGTTYADKASMKLAIPDQPKFELNRIDDFLLNNDLLNDELIDEEYLTYPSMIEVLNRSKISLNFADVNHGGLPTAFFNNVKGRHFEIPACGACQVSTPCDILNNYFEFNKEIIVVNSIKGPEGMISWIQGLLSDDKLRQRIADAGRNRVNLEHRWEHRFGDIIRRIKEFRE